MKKTPKILKIERRIGEPIDKYLRREYVDERMSTHKIAKRLGASAQSIHNWLREYNIKTREQKRSLRGSVRPSKKDLEKMYVEGEMSIVKISERLSLGNKTVNSLLREYNIEIRTYSEARLPKGFVKPSKENLKRMYVDERMSLREIGRILEVDPATVLNWMRKYSIETRDLSEATSMAQLPKGFVKPSKENLKRMYVDQEKSIEKIGKIFGISNDVVLDWLKEYSIKTRKKSELPKGFVKPSKEELERMYIDQKFSTYNIAKRLSVSNTSIIKWLRKYNIPIRSNKPISNSQFKDFLKDNQPALNLAGASVILNGQGSDAERIIIELYREKFKDLQQLHNLINENKEGIYKIIREGLTNLGTYIGNYTLNDRAIIPILISQAISTISNEKLTSPLEERVVRILRNEYSPAFNDNPQETISRLERTIGQYEGRVRAIYQNSIRIIKKSSNYRRN